MCGSRERETGSRLRRKPLRANPKIRRSRNNPGNLVLSVMSALVLHASPAFAQVSANVSEIGEGIVAAFGLLLWVTGVLSLCWLTMRVISTAGHRRPRYSQGLTGHRHFDFKSGLKALFGKGRKA